MTTTANQFRIEFTAVTANGDKKASTIWMNTLEEAKASKWIDAKDAVIIEREKPQHQTLAQWKASRN